MNNADHDRMSMFRSNSTSAGATRSAASWADPSDSEFAFERMVENREWFRRFKRCLDIAVVLIAGPAVLIVIGLAAVAILLISGRPVFFTQDRVGWKGRIFKICKLRTMTTESSVRSEATNKDDKRITPLGKFLRRSHIDELPQLWNIMIGDMTLIGPRPEQPHLADLYSRALPNFNVRHLVVPGLSGLSQVQFGYAGDLEETREKLKWDLLYIENFGWKTDVHIIARTVRVYFDRDFVR